MLIACWSAKGGSGTSVVAAALAVALAVRSVDEVLLVDLDGDQPALLGVPHDGNRTGVRDWLAADAGVGVAALQRLEIDVRPRIRLLPAGSDSGESRRANAAVDAERLVRALAEGVPPGVIGGRPVVVDCGNVRDNALGAAVAAGAGVSLLVMRPCYLALRRAIEAPLRPSAVVVIDEPSRALAPTDIEDALGVPVEAVVRWAPEVARAADAGLLSARIPRVLAGPLRRVAS